jgi:hypothetical protein
VTLCSWWARRSPYIEFLPAPGQARAEIELDPMRIGLRYPADPVNPWLAQLCNIEQAPQIQSD